MVTIDESQHSHMSFLHNKNLTTSKFYIFLHILTISKLFDFSVYAHLGLMFTIVMFADEGVG